MGSCKDNSIRKLLFGQLAQNLLSTFHVRAEDQLFGSSAYWTIRKKIKNYYINKRYEFFRLIAEKYPNYKSQYDIFEQLVDYRINRTTIVLDAGCGRNPTLSKSKEKAKCVIGIDLISEIKENESLDFPVYGNIDILPFKNEAFDLVICRNVIEHLIKPNLFFLEVKRVLKSKGRLMLVTPNVYGFRSLMARIIPNRFHKQIIKAIDERDEDDAFPTYFRANTLKVLDSKLNSCGLCLEHLVLFQGYPPLPFSLLLTRAMILYERLLNRFSTLAFLRAAIIAIYMKN